jgi:hypothetical protein
MKIRKLLASAATALLIGTGLSLAVAAPASAHYSTVTGIAECQEDGTYTVTWRYESNAPGPIEAETKAMNSNPGQLADTIDGVLKGGQLFLSVWKEHQINNPGVRTMTGDWTAYFQSVGIPGDAKKVTTMVQTDWKHGPSEDPVGEVILPGDCKPPVVVPEKPAPMTGVEKVTSEPVCVEPANGDLTYTDSERTWTQDWTLDKAKNEWVLGDKVFSEWVVTATHTEAAKECRPPIPPGDLIEGEWSKPAVTCESKVGDEVGIVRELTSIPRGWDEETKTYVPRPEGAETVLQRDVHIVTAADLEGLEDCPVVTPPTEEPPVEEPPAEEPPVVTPPAPTETPAAVVPVSNDTPRLAATGGTPLNPWFLTLGALSVALGALSIMLTVLRRHPRSEV